MYGIVSIPKPDNLPTRRSTESKYPFSSMKVGDSFVVPYGDMQEGDDEEKFRGRVAKSAREYARRMKTEDGKASFTVAIMQEDDKSDAKAFVKGDVVVWRDA